MAGTRNIGGGRHPEGQIIWRPVPQDGSQDLFERIVKGVDFAPLKMYRIRYN